MSNILITGGAGFIGTNLAHRLLSQGAGVRIFDNLSRRGSEQNLRWLMHTHRGKPLEFRKGDVREPRDVNAAVEGMDRVFHFAAQVAVTTSVVDPVTDFMINASGTLNVLEAARRQSRPPSVFYTSTNKTYGGLDDIALERTAAHYRPKETRHRLGINESRVLDFHSPYGCSKGAADQYVRDYYRIYGLNTVVFRMSCIYGPHQMGNEDQGWVAHFVLKTLQLQPLTIYGDGAQVRDLLFVGDLMDAFLSAEAHLPLVAGKVFNVGGGVRNAVSLIELLRLLGDYHGSAPRYTFRPWRPGDQRYYVSDYGSLRSAIGWEPKTNVREGVGLLYEWLSQQVPAAEVHAAEAS